jgi:hypothetical protein
VYIVTVLVLCLKVQSVLKAGCLKTLIVQVGAIVVVDLRAETGWKGEHALVIG